MQRLSQQHPTASPRLISRENKLVTAQTVAFHQVAPVRPAALDIPPCLGHETTSFNCLQLPFLAVESGTPTILPTITFTNKPSKSYQCTQGTRPAQVTSVQEKQRCDTAASLPMWKDSWEIIAVEPGPRPNKGPAVEQEVTSGTALRSQQSSSLPGRQPVEGGNLTHNSCSQQHHPSRALSQLQHLSLGIQAVSYGFTLLCSSIVPMPRLFTGFTLKKSSQPACLPLRIKPKSPTVTPPMSLGGRSLLSSRRSECITLQPATMGVTALNERSISTAVSLAPLQLRGLKGGDPIACRTAALRTAPLLCASAARRELILKRSSVHQQQHNYAAPSPYTSDDDPAPPPKKQRTAGPLPKYVPLRSLARRSLETAEREICCHGLIICRFDGGLECDGAEDVAGRGGGNPSRSLADTCGTELSGNRSLTFDLAHSSKLSYLHSLALSLRLPTTPNVPTLGVVRTWVAAAVPCGPCWPVAS
ncbi:Protein S-Myc [Liparis tanakae]|uniref:Protein S-Myc n=1 Tax=Liparis tanakae TaxID=230148 RepID=A0A4Z2H9V5_9TELE|nr:Protein S-Myc [Liparis tanakae]